MSKWHGGKGDEQRPTNRQRFAENYEAIFNKKANSDGILRKAEIAITKAKGGKVND
jgi:hypothetical protein